MNRRGVTMIELVLVIVLIGVMAGFAFPRIGDGINRQGVSSARTLFVGTVARARATAIQRGTRTQMVVNGGRITIQAANPVTGVMEAVGQVEDLGDRYGVAVQPTAFTLNFDGRGIGMETTETIVSITKGTHGAEVIVSPVGRIFQ